MVDFVYPRNVRIEPVYRPGRIDIEHIDVNIVRRRFLKYFFDEVEQSKVVSRPDGDPNQ